VHIDDPVLGPLKWNSQENTFFGTSQDTLGNRVPLAVWFDSAAGGSDEIVARARLSLQRFRTREREYRLLSAAGLNGVRWPTKITTMAEEDVANWLLVSAFRFLPDGTLRVYWYKGAFMTEIAPNGEFVRLWFC